jgi:molecular chaperone HtpG
MTDFILFKNLDGKYLTTPEALQINKEAEEEAAKAEAVDENGNKVEAEVLDADGNPVASDSENKADTDKAAEDTAKADDMKEEKEKEPRTIYYVTDEQQQSQYINMFKAQKMDAFIMNHNIDVPFMEQLERKNEGIRFQRIDADLTDTFKSKTSKKAAAELEEKEKELSEKIKKALKNDKLNVRLEKLKDKKMSSVLTVSEESRRMAEMMKMYAMNGMSMGDFGNEGQTLILNANHPLVEYIMEHKDGDNSKMIAEQLYDLARIQNAPLDAEAMTKFIARSNEIMMVLAK